LSCSELLKLANQQLEAARACNVAADAMQCTGSVMTPCNCEVPVGKDTTTETKDYLATLKRLKDKDCTQVCTALACIAPNNAQCKASGSSIMGTCVATSHGPTP
jgi:hypothetical protein